MMLLVATCDSASTVLTRVRTPRHDGVAGHTPSWPESISTCSWNRSRLRTRCWGYPRAGSESGGEKVTPCTRPLNVARQTWWSRETQGDVPSGCGQVESRHASRWGWRDLARLPGTAPHRFRPEVPRVGVLQRHDATVTFRVLLEYFTVAPSAGSSSRPRGRLTP